MGSLKRNKSFRIILSFAFTCFFLQSTYAEELDSLKTSLTKTTNDSVKISVLMQIAEICDESQIDDYANQSLRVLEKAYTNHKISVPYYTIEKARALYNIGFYHFTYTNNYIETINYILNSITLLEAKPDTTVNFNELLSSDYNTIATAYIRIGKNDLSEKYLLKSIYIDKKIGNQDYLTNDYNNIAGAYYALRDYDKAIYYYNLAINIARKNNDTLMLAVRYTNIAEMYFTKRNLQKVEEYLNLALNNLKNQPGSSNYFHYYKIKFKLLLTTKKLGEAKALIPVIQNVKHVNTYEYADYLKYLHTYYIQTGNYKLALEAYKKYTAVQDSEVNETIKVKTEVKQITFYLDKKQLDEKNKNDLKLAVELEKRQKQTFISIVIFLICIIIAGFSFIFYKRLKLTQKQNKIIEKQNVQIQNQHQLLEIKNKSITDSINYSKSIQTTLLAHHNRFNTYFKQSFVIYEPKDVIGGDFYWTQKIGDNLLVVVGDCTGHGVPGALISVLAIEALNKIYPSLQELNDPDELIKKLRTEFNKYYESESLVSIGIDLSVMYIDKVRNSVTLGGSGAVMIGFHNTGFTKYKFDSYNIGGKLPATYSSGAREIPLTNEDVFYIFTDGIVDMKGGDLNKRFTEKKLVHLLESLQHLSFDEQKIKIEETIYEWCKNAERIDDITLLAIKL